MTAKEMGLDNSLLILPLLLPPPFLAPPRIPNSAIVSLTGDHSGDVQLDAITGEVTRMGPGLHD